MSPSAAQLALPIYTSREAVLDAVKENQIVVVEAPTGSGKTTQLPQARQADEACVELLHHVS